MQYSYSKFNTNILEYFLLISFTLAFSDEGIIAKDLGNDMKIDITDGGYKSVKLKCGANSMHVDLETEDDFEGVIYTRGSFHDKQSPCFFDPGFRRGQRSFSIKFPLDKCQTTQKENIYSNVLVLQHDKDLIMPGDAAFNLECDFRKPREIIVSADINSDNKSVVSKIGLTDVDPSVTPTHRDKRYVEDFDTAELVSRKEKTR